jgi:asparaginyl-tRNA synthetase
MNPAKQRLKAVLSIRSTMLEAARDWLNKRGFIEVQGPILLPGHGEKPNHFKVDFFGRTAYLSGGLNPYSDTFLEMFDKIYTIAPTFRAEPLKTKRHLAEFWRIEALSLCSFEDILGIQEQLLTHIASILVKDKIKELSELNSPVESLRQIKFPFPRLTYEDAVEKLQKNGVKIFWGQTIDRKMEIKLANLFTQPFFITEFPVNGETLFHKPVPHRGELTLSADLFAPDGYGEIGGGSELLTKKKLINDRLDELGVESTERQWYFNLKKFKPQNQSVFALGIERILHWICRSKDIADTIAFPRKYDEIFY